RTIATVSADHRAMLWDAATGKLLVTLRGHTGPISDIDFSLDGSRVITASLDRTARVWDTAVCLPAASIVATITQRIGRGLTIEERVESGLLIPAQNDALAQIPP